MEEENNRPSTSNEADVKPAAYLPHHSQQELCTTRAAYRRGKKLTAVKVYTVNKESQHLLIYYVPAIDVKKELAALCNKFGLITLLEFVARGENDDKFSEVYHVRYEKIVQARFAKRQLDNRSFYGSLLHVCYAPELETYEETSSKLINRRSEIAFRTGRVSRMSSVPATLTSGGPSGSAFRKKSKGKALAAGPALDSKDSLSNSFPALNPSFPSTSTCVYPSQLALNLPGTSQAVVPSSSDPPPTKKRKTNEQAVKRIIFYRTRPPLP